MGLTFVFPLTSLPRPSLASEQQTLLLGNQTRLPSRDEKNSTCVQRVKEYGGATSLQSRVSTDVMSGGAVAHLGQSKMSRMAPVGEDGQLNVQGSFHR